MEIALFQPDIAGNVGTILRTAACFGTPAHIVEPCGFPFSDAALKRAGMDYAVRANVRRHPDWGAFERSEEHTSELQSLMRISYAVFCLKKKKRNNNRLNTESTKQRLTHRQIY